MRSVSSISLPLLAILIVLVTQVRAVTYLDSLAAKRRPTASGSTPGPNLVPSLLSRQSGGELAKLYACANISVNATLADVSCKQENTTSVDLVSGLTKTTTSIVCTPVTLNVQVIDDICICASGGAITPASLATLEVFVRDPVHNYTGSAVYLLTAFRNNKVAYTVESLLSYFSQNLPVELNTKSTTCRYPTNAVPYCAPNCAYNCPDGTRPCGNTCLANNRACVSNNLVRRSLRDSSQVELDFRCPAGKSACALPQPAHGGSIFISDRIECIDTSRDIESCGGCAFPLPGRQSGADCTAIPHAGRVSCVSGTCIVNTCQPGYVLLRGECVHDLKQPSGGLRARYSAPRHTCIDETYCEGSELFTELPGSADASNDTDAQVLPVLGGAARSLSVADSEAADLRRTAGKESLARRQLTTKQLLERQARKIEQKSKRRPKLGKVR